jgi:multiple sugar transport system permease protein
MGVLRRGIIEDIRKDKLSVSEKESILGYALILPALLLLILTFGYPLLRNVFLSFHEVPVELNAKPEYVGLEHFRTLISDPEFFIAFRNTILFALASDLIATLIGLGIALLFVKEFKGRRIARGLMLLPYIAPLIAVVFVWRLMWDPNWGIVSYFFSNILNIYGAQTDMSNSLVTLTVYEAWRYYPFAFLLILARLQSIPNELYEAAKMDGAGAFARFKDITLPQLKYVLGTVFLIRWIWNFNTFADVWLFNPDLSVLAVFVYVQGFNQFNQGYAAAVSMLMSLFLIVFSAIYVVWVIEW